MPMMNFRLAQPEMLVDLNRIDGLDGIALDGGHLKIGAMTRYAALQRSALVAENAPLIAMALPHVAHPAIRNRGTIGGSVALADPAAEMPALMLALGAEVVLAGPAGERTVAAADFFFGLYDTALDEGELITALRIPAAAPGDTFGFHEIARRHGDYAMAGVAVALVGGSLRIAFFGVADKAVRTKGAEALLTADITAVDAAVSALDEIEFIADLNGSVEAKQHYAGVVLRRALAGMQP